MARRLIYQGEADAAALQVAEMVGRAKPKKKSAPSRKAIAKVQREVAEMRKSDDFKAAQPLHIVALYAWLHEQVYGIPPGELDGRAWWGASGMAERMIASEFDGNVSRAVAFLRWTWTREKSKEQWRRQNGVEGGRIGYRLQFGQSFLTDYRLACARRTHA